MKREPIAAIHLLGSALRESVDTTRHNSFARMVSLELMEHRGPVTEDALELALAIGTIE